MAPMSDSAAASPRSLAPRAVRPGSLRTASPGTAGPPHPRAGAPRAAAALGFLLAGCLILSGGCAGRGGWVQEFPDIADRARAAPISFVDPVFEPYEGARGLASSYSLRASRGIGRASVDLYVAIERPRSLRIEVLDPAAATEAFLIANDDEVGMWVAEESVLYRGARAPGTFERALGLEIGPEDAIALLLGYGAERDAYGLEHAAWDENARRVRLDLAARTSLWLHPVGLRVDRVRHHGGFSSAVEAWITAWNQLSAAAEGLAESRATAGVTVEGGNGGTPPLPTEIAIEVEDDGLRLELRQQRGAIFNPDFPPGSFSIPEVRGATVLPLDALAYEGGLLRRQAREQ